MEKTLSDGVYTPLLVSYINGVVTLRQDKIILRLGPVAAKWLNEALRSVWQGHNDEQALVHLGKIVLRVHSSFPFSYIAGERTRFTLSFDLLQKLLMWFPNSS